MARIERDRLRELDWSRVYADVPIEVDDAARQAFARIRRRGMRRRRIVRAVAAAACAVLVAGAAALLLRGSLRAPDRVVPLAPETIALSGNDTVYASRADACFHIAADCPNIAGEAVELKVVTALEFEKELCPECGKGYAVRK